MPAENPFKGPSSYEDGDKFYGREIEIKELSSLIKNELLTLLFSRSGTGKSSLIKAGLFPFLKLEYEFFPVYIHLNDAAVKETSAHTLCDFVIKRCEEEITRQFGNNENFKINLTENRLSDSLFEFIHNTDIIEIDKTGSTEYIIKPVLVFDQFEEIFTNPLDKNELQFLLHEIRCLVENEVPDYLNEAITISENDQYQKLRNTLKNKQKNFRVLFAFREEYLPQFESLKKEIPSIRFTNSRYRLEPFTIDNATDIIEKTAPLFTPVVARSVATNIATDVEGFDDRRVDPFLMSLICQIIYFDLLEEIRLNGEVEDVKIKALVENALESYVSKLYNGISNETKKFVEDRLITTDGKKNSVNYNEVVVNPVLKSDIDPLVDNPDSRLLSVGQFLDSKHISILHDRLLPPLILRKEERKNKEENAALIAKQQELVNSNKKKQRRLVAFLIGGTLLLTLYSYVIKNQKLKAEDLKEKAESANHTANLAIQQADDAKKEAALAKMQAKEISDLAYHEADSTKRELKKMIIFADKQTQKANQYKQSATEKLKDIEERAEYYKDLVDRNEVGKDLAKDTINIQTLGNALLFYRVFDELLSYKKLGQAENYENLLESVLMAIKQKDIVLAQENSFKGYLKAKEIWKSNEDVPFLDSILLYNFFNKTIFYKEIISLNENSNPNFNASKTILSFSGSVNSNDPQRFTFNNSNNIFFGSYDAGEDSLKVSSEPFFILNDTASLNSLVYDKNKIIGLLNTSVFTYEPGEKKVTVGASKIKGDNYFQATLSPNGKYLITSSDYDSVILWKLDNLNPVDSRVLNVKPSVIKSIIFSSNSEKFLIHGVNDDLQVYSIDFLQTKKIPNQNVNIINPLFGYKGIIRAANFTPDDKQVIMLSGNQIYIQGLAEANAFPKFEVSKDLIDDDHPIKSISLSPDLKKLLIETTKDIIVLKHFNNNVLITPPYKYATAFINKKFQNDNYIKAAAFLDSNSVITIDEEGKVYLCRIYPEFKTIDEAFKNIISPPLSVLTVFEQFKINPTESMFTQILNSNDDALIKEAAQISYDKYYKGLSKDILDLSRARKLYSKLISHGSGFTEEDAEKIIQVNRSTLVIDTSKQTGAICYRDIVKIIERDIIFLTPNQLSYDYGNLAWFSFFTGDFEDALKYAKKGIAFDSTNSFIYTNLALGYLFNKQFAEAEKVYNDLKDSFYRDGSKKFKDAFKEDFADMKKYGIINETDALIYAEVKKIKRDILKLAD